MRALGGLRRRRLERRRAAPKLLRAFAAVRPEAFFVEIGANDGIQHDHLRPFVLSGRWSGIMVEPVPAVFERLRANYAGVDRVKLENAAIGAADGVAPFYHLADPSPEERAALPDWHDAIGSFSKEFVLGHARHIPDVEQRLVCTEVRTLTFDSLCRAHGVERVDLVVVDTEGADAEVVAGIDLAAWKPDLLVYEHYHLSPEDRAACAERVRGAGYRLLEEGFDTFCLSTGADPRLVRTFGRLRPAFPGVSVHEEVT